MEEEVCRAGRLSPLVPSPLGAPSKPSKFAGNFASGSLCRLQANAHTHDSIMLVARLTTTTAATTTTTAATAARFGRRAAAARHHHPTSRGIHATTSHAASSSSSASARSNHHHRRSGGRSKPNHHHRGGSGSNHQQHQQPQRKPLSSEPERLSKVLSRAGVASRRKSEDIIVDGRVTVNGDVVTKPQTHVRWGIDRVELDGVRLIASSNSSSSSAPARGRKDDADAGLFHFLLNKPKGYICSNDTTTEGMPGASARRPVVDLFRPWLARWAEKQRLSLGDRLAGADAADASVVLPPRLFTVGRLDVATTGLLLVTNDGVWANRVAHPSHGVTKEYVVTCATKLRPGHLERIAGGCMVEGAFVVPHRVEVFDPNRSSGDRKRAHKVR